MSEMLKHYGDISEYSSNFNKASGQEMSSEGRVLEILYNPKLATDSDIPAIESYKQKQQNQLTALRQNEINNGPNPQIDVRVKNITETILKLDKVLATLKQRSSLN